MKKVSENPIEIAKETLTELDENQLNELAGGAKNDENNTEEEGSCNIASCWAAQK